MKSFIIALFFLAATISFGQRGNSIKVKKNSNPFYFYQKGDKTDTITGAKGNVFCLIAGDSVKNHLSIFAENGQLLGTSNDSIFTFKYIKGINYECFFKPVETRLADKPKYEFKTLVNGTSAQPFNIITFRFKTNDNKILLEDRFYYKN